MLMNLNASLFVDWFCVNDMLRNWKRQVTRQLKFLFLNVQFISVPERSLNNNPKRPSDS